MTARDSTTLDVTTTSPDQSSANPFFAPSELPFGAPARESVDREQNPDRSRTHVRGFDPTPCQYGGDPETWRELTKSMPFGRPAKPEEIGAMIAFLASDRSGYTSGSVVTIDAGISARAAS